MNTPALIHSNPLHPQGAARSIGDILVSSGRLSPENATRIINQQRLSKLPFGEAAIALQILTKEDIDFALSKQFNYSYLSDDDETLSPQLVAAYQPFSRVGENLRAVRSQLRLRWFKSDPLHKVLAVVSPGAGEGRSFIAANLAVVFAQQGERTLLIDGDLRAPSNKGQAALFKLGSGIGLSSVLAGRAGLEAAKAVPSLPGLSVLPAGAVPPNPQELLGRLTFGQLLFSASMEFDVILIDTPSAGEFADANIIASRAGAALMVARKDKSSMPDAALLAQRLQECDVNLVGSVLNDG
ncbi:MAG: chain length determinant protein tyrosine kinase EpsG [Rhodoferax sp.]|nr:chain length determinant protein tyrosine kinase EpsG [Rhodoferax sp.]